MKRLLACLFLVLGLGLVVSASSFASASLCINKEGKYIYFTLQSSKYCKGYAIEKKINKDLYKRIKWHANSKSSSNNYGEPWSINKAENHFNTSVEEIFYFISANHDDPKWENFVKKTLGFTFKRQNFFRKNNSGELVNVGGQIGEKVLIAKKEPTQTQQVAEKHNKVALIIGIEKYKALPKATFANKDANYFAKYAEELFGVPKKNIKLLVDEDATFIKSAETIYEWLPVNIKYGQTELIIFFSGHGLSDGKNQYLLSHDSDPDFLSTTALSTDDLYQRINMSNPKSVTVFLDTSFAGTTKIISEQSNIPENFTVFYAARFNQIASSLKKKKQGIFSYFLMSGLQGNADFNKDKKITNGELFAYMHLNVSQKASEIGRHQNPSFVGDPFKVLINSKKTQIAKKETKKKVAKVVEQEQKEFKPKKKDIDNDPPRIEIAEAITVDSQAYTIKGKVKDKSQIYLTIDDRQVEVKGGRFKVDRFNIDPDVAEEIKIVAIDKWNNRSEKIVKVTVKLKATEVVRTYEDLKPNSVRVSMDKNKIAIIIGVEKYKNMTECNYCNRDAKAFKAYATRALGVMPSNVISLVDSNATRGEILRAFKISLPRIASDGGKDINIFFAGHGLASESGEDLYIIPQDGDQGLLEDTAVSRVELIKLIKRVNPKSVTMFFDTCYSGQTRGEQMLVASLRGIRILDTDDIPDNFSIFTASSSKQASSHIEEIKHGMFSYYLMKGLEGKADDDNNKVITNGELIAYLKKNVSKEAFGQNREQDPMLSGNPDQVLMKY